MIIAAGKFLLVELDKHPLPDGLLVKSLLFLLAAIHPEDLVWLAEFGGGADKIENGLVVGLGVAL